MHRQRRGAEVEQHDKHQRPAHRLARLLHRGCRCSSAISTCGSARRAHHQAEDQRQEVAPREVDRPDCSAGRAFAGRRQTAWRAPACRPAGGRARSSSPMRSRRCQSLHRGEASVLGQGGPARARPPGCSRCEASLACCRSPHMLGLGFEASVGTPARPGTSCSLYFRARPPGPWKTADHLACSAGSCLQPLLRLAPPSATGSHRPPAVPGMPVCLRLSQTTGTR